MENYTNNIDLSILEELSMEDARGYMIGKYGLDFAEETTRIMQKKIDQNEQEKNF